MFAMPAKLVPLMPAAQLLQVFEVEQLRAADRHPQPVHDQRHLRRQPVQKLHVSPDLAKTIGRSYSLVVPERIGNYADVIYGL